MSLEKRLKALEAPHGEPEWSIHVLIHHPDGGAVLGPDDQTITPEEAERSQADADMVIDLRRTRGA